MNTSPVNAHIENVLLIVMLQLAVIIAAARFFGWAFRKMGQPQVCGEIAAGLILGPSLFGRFFPEISMKVFNPSVNQIFSIMSQIGLVLLMFLVGLEFEFGHLKQNRRAALSVSAAGILLPFALGFLWLRYPHTHRLAWWPLPAAALGCFVSWKIIRTEPSRTYNRYLALAALQLILWTTLLTIAASQPQALKDVKKLQPGFWLSNPHASG